MLYLSNFSVNLKLLQNKKGYFLKVLSKKKKKARKTKNPIIYLQNSHVLKNKIFKKCDTSDLLECLKLRGLSTPSVGKCVEKLEHFWQENKKHLQCFGMKFGSLIRS